MSGGTRASLAGAIVAPGYAWRDGRIVTERGAKRIRSFDVAGKQQVGDQHRRVRPFRAAPRRARGCAR